MAQFPVVDQNGALEALNYLLSGPSATGQRFASYRLGTQPGVNSVPVYVTGNSRPTYSSQTNQIYVPAIALASATQLDDQSIEYVFAAAQPTAPFAVGSRIITTGCTPSTFDKNFLTIDNFVAACSTTSGVVKFARPLGTLAGPATGGSISKIFTGLESTSSGKPFFFSTDATAKLTVDSGQSVLISGQTRMQNLAFTATGTCIVTIEIDLIRYSSYATYKISDPDFAFKSPEIIAKRIIRKNITTPGAKSYDNEEFIFTGTIDSPEPGYYLYAMQIKIASDSNPLEITNIQLDQNSIVVSVLNA